ncbi:MAG: hypothetical protein HQL56_09090 [Magnetococcales bacterium]|nr:hypothetical protein [Magnetococcales bacterium]
MRYDTTLKDLFHEPPQTLLRLLVGKRGVALWPVEFPSTMKRIPDLLFELDDLSLLHLDLQGAPESMDWRMLMYFAFIRQRHPDRVVVQKVLYVGMYPWKPAAIIREPNLFFRYDVIDIRDIDCQEMLASASLEENILAVLCRMDNGRNTIREILRRIDRLKPKARADALTKLVIISGLRKLELTVQEEADNMAITVDVMENAVLRNLFLKARQESEREGEQIGQQIGQQIGLQKGKIDMLLELLQERFGAVPEGVKTRLAAADADTLKACGKRLFTAESIDQIFS